MGPFELQMRAIAERVKDKANVVVRKFMFDIGTGLVMKSPVGDAKYWKAAPPKGYVGGRFRANWQFGVGTINQTTTTATDMEGDKTLGRLEASIPEDVSGQVFFITNSLPYAQRIEDGWSRRQAPAGVVGLTWVEWRDYLNRIIVEVR